MTDHENPAIERGVSDVNIEVTTNPPTNDVGEYVCGRECADGSPCENVLAVPFLPCHQHDTDAPIIGPRR